MHKWVDDYSPANHVEQLNWHLKLVASVMDMGKETCFLVSLAICFLTFSACNSRWAEVLEAPAQIETPSAEDALWICQTDLLRCFDCETHST